MATMSKEHLHHYLMPVEGTEWEQWKARIWNQLYLMLQGNPGLSALEQWTRRSAKEKRCVECGEHTDNKIEGGGLIKSVAFYFMCPECVSYYERKHGN